MSDAAVIGITGIIATLVGSLGSIWLKDYLDRTHISPTDRAAKTLLLNLLNRPKWRWRKLETLANVVGTDEVTVRRLLLEIGARGSMADGRLWGLVSRNPIADQSGGPSHDPVILELGPGEPPEDEEDESAFSN